MKLYLFLIPILLSAQQVDYNRQVMNKPTLTTINGGSLPSSGSITKIDGSGHLAAAVSGTDYAAPGSFTLPFLRATTDCGLTMNGTTDDTTALSNCINALPAGGGTIVFPIGVSIISNLVITRNNVHLLGQGNRTTWSSDVGSTVFKYGTSATVGGFVLKFSGTGGYTNVNSSIEKITFDGNERAATGVWLLDTFMFYANRFTIDHYQNGYGLVVEGTGITTTPRCGDGSGAIILDNYYIWGSTGSGGIQFGNYNYDVCSIKSGKAFIETDMRPPRHGIFAYFLDSSTFADTTFGSLNALTVSSISCTSNVCTITTPVPHNLRSPQGIHIRSSTPQLRGNFAATSTGTYTMTISVPIPDGSYTATSLGTTSLELGSSTCPTVGKGCAWDNGFGYILTDTGLYEWQNPGTTSSRNTITQWNWTETTGGDPWYANPGSLNAYDMQGNFWNAKFKTQVKFNPVRPTTYGLTFGSGAIQDYGVGIDFASANPVTSIGYYPLRLFNNTFVATRNAANTQDMVLLGANSSNQIIIGSVFNPSGTRAVFVNQPQLNSAVPPACDATTRGTLNYLAGGGGVKDSVQVCGKDAGDSFSWRTLW